MNQADILSLQEVSSRVNVNPVERKLYGHDVGDMPSLIKPLMKPVFPVLFPMLLPGMMPKVMDSLMPHMIKDLVPLVTYPMINFLTGENGSNGNH
jgi:hypothetical protein